MLHETEHQKTRPLADGVVLIKRRNPPLVSSWRPSFGYGFETIMYLNGISVLTIDRHRGLGICLGDRVYRTFQHASLLGRRGVADSPTFLLWSSLATESRGNRCRVTEHHPRPNSFHLLNTLISSILEWLLLAAWCLALQADQHHRYERLVSMTCWARAFAYSRMTWPSSFKWRLLDIEPLARGKGGRGGGGGGVLNVSRWCWYRHLSLARTERRLRWVNEWWDGGMNAYHFIRYGSDLKGANIGASIKAV